MNSNGSRFVSGAKASQILGVSQQTLRTYADANAIEYIRTPGGKRRYNVDSFVNQRTNVPNERNSNDRKSIIYARVSTRKQQRDLEHRVEFLKSKFPDFEVITDIGSGVNFKRRGFKRILELAMSGDVKTIAVAHRDRLCRVSFDLVEWVLQRHGCETIVVQNTQVHEGPDAEFVDDIISIIHSFSARTYGHRSYRTRRRKEDDDLPAECNKGDV